LRKKIVFHVRHESNALRLQMNRVHLARAGIILARRDYARARRRWKHGRIAKFEYVLKRRLRDEARRALISEKLAYAQRMAVFEQLIGFSSSDFNSKTRLK